MDNETKNLLVSTEVKGKSYNIDQSRGFVPSERVYLEEVRLFIAFSDLVVTVLESFLFYEFY